MLIPDRVYQRVVTKTDRDVRTGCLVSRYSSGSHGYAQVGWDENGEHFCTLAHLALWIYLEGEVPDGFTVDHRCHNRKCVERTHLRLLSNFDNARRTNGRDWPLGECAQGHPDSLLRQEPGGRWRCSACKLASSRQTSIRQRAERAALGHSRVARRTF